MKYKEKLDKLMATIAVEVENQPSVRFLDEGDACVAQWEDLAWYRARVLSKEESTAKVEFVDYGNIDDIITEDLRVIKPSMLVDHVYCIRCMLNNVHVTSEKEEAAVEYLSQTLVEEGPTVHIMINEIDYDQEVAMVTLIQDGVNMNEFIQKQYGPTEDTYHYRELILGEKIKLQPMEASSLSRFPCLLNDSRKQLELMMRDVSEHYTSTDNRRELTAREIDTPCCVFRESDSKWYRGSIVETGTVVSVKFVDYGFCEEVAPTNIYKLETLFFRLAVQSVDCRLFNLLPVKEFESCSVEAVGYFNEICKGKTLTAQVINNTDGLYSVALTFENGETVYEMLTSKNLTSPVSGE
jgi:tudor domain-containing protein 1/4/6/7